MSMASIVDKETRMFCRNVEKAQVKKLVVFF